MNRILIIVLLTACTPKPKIYCGGDLKITNNMSESIKNEIFLCEYEIDDATIVVPEYDVELKVKEIYSEYQYRRLESGKIEKLNSSQLIIRLKNKIPDSYAMQWNIRHQDNIYFTNGIDYLVADFPNINCFDSLCFSIKKSRYSDNVGYEIGILKIHLKKN